MVKGLTDRESLQVILKESREDRVNTARIKAIAEKGLHQPGTLTSEETQEVCDSVLRHLQKRPSFFWP